MHTYTQDTSKDTAVLFGKMTLQQMMLMITRLPRLATTVDKNPANNVTVHVPIPDDVFKGMSVNEL